MSNLRDISSIGLSPSELDLLRMNGFRYTSEVLSMKPLDLSSELSISPAQALRIIKLCQGIISESNDQVDANKTSLEGEILTAKDLLLGIQKPIVTFVKELDTILGGGIPLGQITEFSGVPGVRRKFYFPFIIFKSNFNLF